MLVWIAQCCNIVSLAGAGAYLAGFAPIAAGSLAASAMSAAWTTGVGVSAVSALQSAAATFANCAAFIPF